MGLFIFCLSSCSNGKEIDNSNALSSTKILISNIKNANNLAKDNENSNNKVLENKASKENKKKSTENKKSTEENIKIKAFGDIMAHMPQVDHAYYINGEKGYDFTSQFEYIKDFVSDADISIGNFETSVNPDRSPSGYPRFTTPKDYIKDIKDTGFDVLTTANNHSADSGEKGIFDTITYMDDYGMAHVGTRKKEGNKILYRQVGNFKLAILAYTYGINGLEKEIVENNPSEVINYLTYDEIKKDIEDAKNNKADFIICYPHWGNEYESYPSQDQIKLGREMVEWGVDLVIGNHTHVVQPAETYKAKDGREGYIAYSCGNFVSMQSLESLGDIRCEHSVSFDINIEKNGEDTKAKIKSIDFYPLWVGHGSDEYGQYAKVYRTSDFLEGGKFYDKVDENQRDRIKQADTMVKDIINTKIE